MAVKKKAGARSAPARVTGDQNVLGVFDFAPYKEKKGEEYMSDAQEAHFEAILQAWKKSLMEEVDRTVLHMKDEAANFPDPRAARARPRAQADPQDRRGARPPQRARVWLLRVLRNRDRYPAARGAAHGHAVHRLQDARGDPGKTDGLRPVSGPPAGPSEIRR